MTDTPTTQPTHAQQKGMSLRDWFAGKALLGIIAGRQHEISTMTNATLAKYAYELADAMLTQGKN